MKWFPWILESVYNASAHGSLDCAAMNAHCFCSCWYVWGMRGYECDGLLRVGRFVVWCLLISYYLMRVRAIVELQPDEN